MSSGSYSREITPFLVAEEGDIGALSRLYLFYFVSLYWNKSALPVEQEFHSGEIKVSQVRNEIGLRVSVGHMEPLLYVLLSYGY